MEDYVILLSIMMFGVFALMGMRMFKPSIKVKTSTNKAKDVLSKVNEETIERLSVQLRKVNGRANRLQALRDDEVEDEEEQLTENGGKPVTWEEITALVKTQYPKYAPMLPLFKKQIMDATSGMSMEEILDYVKQIKGNQQPQEGVGIAPDASGYRADWA